MKERSSRVSVRLVAVVAAIGAAGCGSISGQGSHDDGGSSTGGAGTGGAPGSGGAGGIIGGSGGGAVGGGSGGGTGGAGGASICARWKADRADLAEGTWSGNLAACTAGDVTSAGRATALRQVNLFRFIAGLPPVTNDATKDQQAQACALMQDANNMLSHTPPTSWTCYTDVGATAAGQSNIATTAGVRAIGLYMTDRGNETTIGHRRWILSNSLGPIGLGSTSGYSCLLVIGGNGDAGKAYTAWPPPGDVPLQALNLEGAVDSVGWSLHSDMINLAGAQVAVTDAGTNRPVTTTQLPANYGSRYAISFVPVGWTVAAGHTYDVSVTGSAMPIRYSVNVVSCP